MDLNGLRAAVLNALQVFLGERVSDFKIIRVEATESGFDIAFKYHVPFDVDYIGTALLTSEGNILSLDSGLGKKRG